MSLSKDLKRALDALALAHAADYLSQREKEELVGAGSPAAGNAPRTARAKPATTTVVPLRQLPQVALLADAQLPEQLLDYALDTCRHFKAGLLLIDALPQQAGRLTAQLQRIKAANTPLNVCALPQASLAAVHEFVLNQPRLLFVLVSGTSHQALGAPRMQWHSPAPLVVVSEQMPQHTPAAVNLRS